MEFREMGISDKTLSALDALGYVNPTEVQEKVIPEILAGTNLIIRSHTGTGKTAAFGIGIIERISAGRAKKALILTPTRELAVQVCKELRGIGQNHHLRIHVVYGGQSINVQLEEIRGGTDIMIATPGRLMDLSRRGAVHIGGFDISILDEADQMLDMGFIDEVTGILDMLPKQRTTLLVSATVDESILDIAAKYIKSPKTIEIGEIEKAETIEEQHIEATSREKLPRLMEELRAHDGMKILIFRQTKRGVSKLRDQLWQRGVKAGELQGDMSQAQRNRTLADFKEGRIQVLVATNVAARGLHIENLGLIVNYDQAESEEVHLHRIGRTGRMGQEGKAINFIVRKESLNERMSEDHPDFAWMKGGGMDMYRGERGDRRPYGGDRRGGSPYGRDGRRPRGGGQYAHDSRGDGPHGREGGGRSHAGRSRGTRAVHDRHGSEGGRSHGEHRREGGPHAGHRHESHGGHETGHRSGGGHEPRERGGHPHGRPRRRRDRDRH